MKWGRSIVVLAAAIWIAAVLVWVDSESQRSRSSSVSSSVYDNSDEGYSHAFAYLRRRHGAEVFVLARPLTPESVNPDGIVFRLAPSFDFPSFALTKDEKVDEKPARVSRPLLTPDEADWVSRGGSLVFATNAEYGPISVIALESPEEPRKVFPLWSGVHELRPDRIRRIDPGSLTRAHAIFVSGSAVVVARQIYGKGDVILIAAPEIFDNRHLGDADHLALLEALVGGRRVIAFDETVHGLISEPGLLNLLVREWRLGPFLLLLALGAIGVWARGSTRLGPPDHQPASHRSEAIDLVDSLGSLYERSLKRNEMLALYRRSFVRALAARTGLVGAALESRADELVGPSLNTSTGSRAPSADEFHQCLSNLNDAFRRLEHAESR